MNIILYFFSFLLLVDMVAGGIWTEYWWALYIVGWMIMGPLIVLWVTGVKNEETRTRKSKG